MSAYIVHKKLDGSAIGRWEVLEQPIVFGRGQDVDVKIPDERASRQHFAVVLRESACVLRDLNSTNGTWVNNQRVTETKLKPNDRIRAGQTIYVFETEISKGLGTVIDEMAVEGKGYQTLLGEVSKEATQRLPPPPAGA